jgi:trehalose 6-phosphate phosphatase
VIAASVTALAPPPRVIGGKCVVNLLPSDAPTKGEALRELLRSFPSGCALYPGDDDTDEHVFDLPRELVLGIRVGARESSGAALYVDEQAQMLPVLELLASLWPRDDAPPRG